jgi:hypothetical protein
MPSLDPWLRTKLDDQRSVETFLCAHWFRHQTLSYAASEQGVSVPVYDFRTRPDDTWFANHGSVHQSLFVFMAPDQTVDMTVLTGYTWDNQSDFDTWMQMHTLIHDLLDQAFGLQ